MRHIFVAGSGRSGTTWIGDVLSSCRGGYTVYEPLRASLVPDVPGTPGTAEQPAPYLPPDQDDDRWAAFFRRLLAGEISNCWTRQVWRGDEAGAFRFLPAPLRAKAAELDYRIHRWKARHCVIKEIRANMLLAWLSRRFPIRVVYLTRHPCAVVGSRLKLQWKDVLDEVTAQPRLLADFLSPCLSLIGRAKTDLQRMTAHWCIENLVPLRHLEQNPDWIAVHYEACLTRPRIALNELIRKLELTPTRATDALMNGAGGPAASISTRSRAWHEPLSESQGSEVLDICRGFGIDLYGRELMPVRALRAG